jgi:hypothetical protein
VWQGSKTQVCKDEITCAQKAAEGQNTNARSLLREREKFITRTQEDKNANARRQKRERKKFINNLLFFLLLFLPLLSFADVLCFLFFFFIVFVYL